MNQARCDYYTNYTQQNSSDQKKLLNVTKSLLCDTKAASFRRVDTVQLANDFGNFFAQKIENINASLAIIHLHRPYQYLYLLLTLHACVEAALPSGQRVGLAIRRSQVRAPLWPLAGFVLGRPEFKLSATLVNSQLVAFCQLGFLILLCCI